MARPRLSEDQKRKVIGFRLSPRDRARLERVAGDNKNTIGAEVEQMVLDQLAYLESTDEPTRALLGKIGDNLNRIRNRKGRWHSTLTAWAAASEMLARVLDESSRPAKDRPSEDEFVAEAIQACIAADARRSWIVRQLAALNVLVKDNPKPHLLGAPLQGLFGLAPPRSSRDWEAAAIQALPDDIKAKAEPLFAELLEADAESESAWARWTEQMRPYWEAEQEGRRIALELFSGSSANDIALSLLKAPRLPRPTVPK